MLRTTTEKTVRNKIGRVASPNGLAIMHICDGQPYTSNELAQWLTITYLPKVLPQRCHKMEDGYNICLFLCIGEGGGQGGGGNIPFGPPNNPPTFSFNFGVKQEKITNVPS